VAPQSVDSTRDLVARFRTRARAVDMLGRQQIAGIPTAISELLKNAYDAYADNADVDFFRSRRLFVLRDDGVGMDRQDFEERWLTLGTESKLGQAFGLRPPPVAPGKAARPVLGEKGIGRLAVAAIGPQLLVLTRSLSPDRRDQLVMAFLNWTMFAIPGIDLDQLEIPVWVLPGGQLPDQAYISAMVATVRENLDSIGEDVASDLRMEILRQLDAFDVDPDQLDAILGGISLRGDGHGTHFFVQPAETSLNAAIDGPDDDDTAPPLIKMLIGFSNTMTPDHAPKRIEVAFRDRRSDVLVEDLLAESEFFTPDEFRNADHHIAGTFDDFGQFRGTVTVYGDSTQDHLVAWPSRGRVTDCGPFRINLAVVQGVERESTLPNTEWTRLVRKLNRIGGLYIYKDGIRVLPYGNNDYDFLDIERNRTKQASYYYFSFRRMFGVVEIDSIANAALSEKAGREGFRENLAYRQFRDILKNFFVQIAADFFRPGGVRTSTYEVRRAELDRVERARRRQEQFASSRRASFRADLETARSSIQAGVPEAEVAAVVSRMRDSVEAVKGAADVEEAAELLIQSESEAREALSTLRDRFRVSKPRGMGLTKPLRRDFDDYREEYDRLLQLVFGPAELAIETAVRDAESGPAGVGRQVRFEKGLQTSGEIARRTVQAAARETERSSVELRERLASLIRSSLVEVSDAVSEVLTSAAVLSVSGLGDADFVTNRLALEQKIEDAARSRSRALDSVRTRLQAIEWQSGEDGQIVTDLDVAEAVDEELLALRERTEVDIELAQLGMAVQVINHEFDATIRAVRSGLRELNAWADANDALRSLHDRLRASFDHLDGYLTLFTPLQRRLYRRAVSIHGAEIHKFLQDLFDERLRRETVELRATPAFKRFHFQGYPSTFYPVFVNLVDNALYWLSRSAEPRVVQLDVIDGAMVVENNGPAISLQDQEQIFELGFTRKPAGRGLGLYISRDVLAKEGYELSVANSSDFNVVFRIAPASQNSDSEANNV